MSKNKPIRHGELLLLPVDKSKGKVEQHKSYIVAHSETGHHHILESDIDFNVSTEGLEVYLELFEDAELNHKKQVNRHKNVTVPAGIYQVIKKKEYNPFTGLMERVWD